MTTLLKVRKQWYKIKAEDLFPNEQLNLPFLEEIGEVSEVMINTDPFDILDAEDEYNEDMFDAEKVIMFTKGIDGVDSLPYYERKK